MAQRIPLKKHKKTSSLVVPGDLLKLKQYNSEVKRATNNNTDATPYLDEGAARLRKQPSRLDKTRSLVSNKSKQLMILDEDPMKLVDSGRTKNEKHDCNWFEMRLVGRFPDRRAYHSGFLMEDKFYIYGGLDLSQGLLSSMYYLNLSVLRQGQSEITRHSLKPDKSESWYKVEDMVAIGQQHPGPLAHHTSVVQGKKMFLYGGIKPDGSINEHLYCFDTISMTWQRVFKRGVQPTPRDQHTSNVWDDKMVVFGGFENNVRVNTLQIYGLDDQRWNVPEIDPTQEYPQPRAGHSAVVHRGCLYIFGGTDMDNKRLGDLWMYDLIAQKWSQVEGKSLFEVSARSGHSACIFKGFMIVFGGMKSVTKEVDDTLAFNFETKEWHQIFGEKKLKASPKQLINEHLTGQKPLHRLSTLGSREPASALLRNSKNSALKAFDTPDKNQTLQKEPINDYQSNRSLSAKKRLNSGKQRANRKNRTIHHTRNNSAGDEYGLGNANVRRSHQSMVRPSSSIYSSLITNKTQVSCHDRYLSIPTIKPLSRVLEIQQGLKNFSRKLRKDYLKQKAMHAMKDGDEVKIDLSSPTSSHMKNSFIIKNASKNMDVMYKQLRLKQKMSTMANAGEYGSNASVDEIKSATLKQKQGSFKRQSLLLTGSSNRNLLSKATPDKMPRHHSIDLSLKQRQSSVKGSNAGTPGLASNCNFVRYRRPPARDGHSGFIIRDKYLLVFGGDRHRNPFNDSYILDIEEEFNEQGYLFQGVSSNQSVR